MLDWTTQWWLCYHTTGRTSGAGTVYPSGAPEFTPVFSGVRVTRSLVVCVCVLKIVVCPFVLFLLDIVLSVLLRLMDSDYPFGIFKLFLAKMWYEDGAKLWTWINVRENQRAIKNWKSRENCNIGDIRRRQTTQKSQHNMCWTTLCANKYK